MSKVARRRERERLERRSSILDAAEEVFLDKGFDQATMDDIAGEAELSKGTLYLYFKNKDDLYIALSARMAEGVVAKFVSLAEEAPTGMAAVRAMLECYAESIAEHPQQFRIMIGRMASGLLFDPATPSFASHRCQIERIVGAFVAALERGKRDGSLRGDLQPIQTSSQLWSGLLGAMLLQINSVEMARRFPHPVDFNNFVAGYIQMVCDGLRPEAAEKA